MAKVYGADGDAEMPEHGDFTRRPKGPPKPGTNPWLVVEFRRMMREARLGRYGFNNTVLNTALKSLRDDGYSNEEIHLMIETFWIRQADALRAKRDLDAAVAFRHHLPALKSHTEQTIEDKRAGRKTSAERGMEIGSDLKARLMATRGKA